MLKYSMSENTCLMKATLESYHWGEANIMSVIDENVTKAVAMYSDFVGLIMLHWFKNRSNVGYCHVV